MKFVQGRGQGWSTNAVSLVECLEFGIVSGVVRFGVGFVEGISVVVLFVPQEFVVFEVCLEYVELLRLNYLPLTAHMLGDKRNKINNY